MRTLCWNCRGIGDPATVRELCDLVEASVSTVLCLVETQLAKVPCGGFGDNFRFFGEIFCCSSGRSGDLCIFLQTWYKP